MDGEFARESDRLLMRRIKDFGRIKVGCLIGRLFAVRPVINTQHSAYWFTEQRLPSFLNLLKCQRLFQELMNQYQTCLCLYLNPFFVVVPNTAIKFDNSNIYYKFCSIFDSSSIGEGQCKFSHQTKLAFWCEVKKLSQNNNSYFTKVLKTLFCTYHQQIGNIIVPPRSTTPSADKYQLLQFMY